MPPSQQQIKHVVVLMLENRSFDQVLGYLSHGGLTPIRRGSSNRLDLANPNSPLVSSYPYPSDFDVGTDLDHSHAGVVRQLQGSGPPLRRNQINMSGFVHDYRRHSSESEAERAMGWHQASQVPALARLARQFTVCSRWFCSVPGETWPNRMFAHAGHSNGTVNNRIRLYGDDTVFDALSDKGKSWAVYAGDIPQAACYLNLMDKFKRRLNHISAFYDDVEENTLPAYSFLEPRHLTNCNSQHPDASVALGDQLLRSVYNALARNRRIWDSLLFIVTWDEHGGFFDRVPPPACAPPVAGETATIEDDGGRKVTFGFDTLGVRVPAVVVSPWSAKGHVCDTVFDHTSIIKTVYDAFGLPGHLTVRDRDAASVLGALTGTEARNPVKLPDADTATLRSAIITEAAAAAGMPSLSEGLDPFQQSLVELKERLDAHSGAPARAVRLAAAPGADTALDLRRVVHEFRAEHLSTRGDRLREEDDLGIG